MNLAQRLDRVVRRARAFYRATEPGHFLVSAKFPVDSPKLPPLNAFDLDRQLGEWLDLSLDEARPRWQAREGLDDDTIPALCPYFGIAEHSAWLGMDVLFQEDTCLPKPILHEPADLARLSLSEGTRWFQYMKKGYEHLRRRKDGTFVLSVRGTMAPMDLANALRGDEFYLDVLTDPNFVHRLMDWLVPAIRWYYGHLRSWADEIDGGHVFIFGGGWVGPNAIGHLSNDAAMLCSAETYETFGYPYESRLVEGFDRVLYHAHNEKLHFVPRLAALPRLSILQVSQDPKTPAPMEDLPRILAATGRANLMIRGTPDQVRRHIGDLRERNVFLEVSCRDRQEADDVVAFVRDRSKPLE